jgi:hypothetical protein
MKNSMLVLNLLLFAHSAFALDRIETTRFDRSAVKTIYLAPGLGSIILFPCPLLEVFVGRSEDLKAQISPSDKKTLFLNLKLNSSLPTNMITRCEGERNVYVFDVLPSRMKHQDVVDIRSSFGGPGLKTKDLTELPRKSASNKVVLQKPTLINQGETK